MRFSFMMLFGTLSRPLSPGLPQFPHYRGAHINECMQDKISTMGYGEQGHPDSHLIQVGMTM